MIEFKNVSKFYNQHQALSHLNLTINDHDFLSIVGPSGSGKTTFLRCLAALEPIDEGVIYINGQDISKLQPSHRGIAMVFQNYLLFDHLSIKDNILFGCHHQVNDHFLTSICNQLQILDLLDRFPSQLSGGQKQRVAICRALISQPDIILMDEPFSNLDPNLKTQLRQLIKDIHQLTNTTFIYVTHDQNEALSLSNHILVLNEGKIAQYGTPEELYQQPASAFVGSFIGHPPMNLLPYDLLKEIITTKKEATTIGIRPEHLTISNQGQITCRVVRIEYFGSLYHIYTTYKNQTILIQTNELPSTSDLQLYIDFSHIHYF